jgi:ABC-type lipoprotein release transport system permease subunit
VSDVTAVWYRFRAELRSRWRAWLGLGLLVGLAAGAVMALAAGARRTDTAYARFLVAHKAYDVIVFDYEQRGFPGVGGFDKIAALPLVEDSAEGDLDLIPLWSSSVPGIASEDGRIGREINRFKILEGRRADPDRPDEAVVSFATAEDHDLEVGSTLQVLSPDDVERMTDPDEIAAAQRFFDQAPDGRLRVVGIEASPGEFPPQNYADMPMVHLTPAFHDLHLIDDPQTSAKVLLVRLRDGAGGVSAFNAALDRLSDGPAYDALAQADQATVVERSIHLQAVTLWLLAGLVTVSATLILAQLLSRLAFVEGRDHPTLGALGMSGRDRTLLGVVRAAGIAGAGALAGVVVAVAASPLLPTGLARTAEPDLGTHLDAVVLGVGAIATLAVVVAVGAWASWRAASVHAGRPGAAEDDARLRPSGVARALARGGWPLPTKVGVQMALAPGRGRTAVPVRTTLAGVALGVGALVAALTFGASLTHLLDSPRLYGVTWDLQLTADYDDETFADRAMAALRDDPRVEAVGVGSSGSAMVEVDGRRVDAIALDSVDGDLTLPTLAGRAPRGPDEVALGSRTARALGVEIGDTVDVAIPGGQPVPMRFVGRTVFPSVGDASRLGEGLVATVAGAEAVSPPDLPVLYELFARLAPGADPDAVVADLNARAGTKAELQSRGEPSDIVNFGRVEAMPLVLGGILAAIAAATLAHLLLSAVRRRRRDLAILKMLGFVRAQVAATVAWQATTVVIVSLAVAVPLGVALGRWTWTLLADDLGVIARPQVPWLTLAAVVGAALILANAIALVPGQIAARTRPAADLRSE